MKGGLSGPDTRAGVVHAVLAAVSAGALLYLPVLLVGYTMTVVAAVARGEGLAWQSSVAMTYTFLGIPAAVALFLLVIPYALFRAATRRLGTQQAVRWVGGLLVIWHAGVALISVVGASSAVTPAAQADAIWSPVAFGVAAVVILVATVVADRQAKGAAVALAGALAVALIGLVVVLVAVWGTPLRIPTGAQEVHIVATETAVRLDPATVHAGDVYFFFDAPDDPSGHAGFTFVSRGYPGQGGGDPEPMSDEDVARLAQGDYQGTALDGGWAGQAKFTLREGNYVFLIAGPGGGQPGVPPLSMAVLEVIP
ncbi:MAG: hypothetical protein AABM41_03450 [Chloroflexota bacterium]